MNSMKKSIVKRTATALEQLMKTRTELFLYVNDQAATRLSKSSRYVQGGKTAIQALAEADAALVGFTSLIRYNLDAHYTLLWAVLGIVFVAWAGTVISIRGMGKEKGAVEVQKLKSQRRRSSTVRGAGGSEPSIRTHLKYPSQLPDIENSAFVSWTILLALVPFVIMSSTFTFGITLLMQDICHTGMHINDHLELYLPGDVSRLLHFCRRGNYTLYDAYHVHKELMVRTEVGFGDINDINSITDIDSMTNTFSTMYAAHYSEVSDLSFIIGETMANFNLLTSLPDPKVAKDDRQFPCKTSEEFSLRDNNISVPSATKPYNVHFPFDFGSMRTPWEIVCPHMSSQNIHVPLSQDICRDYAASQAESCDSTHLVTDCATALRPAHSQQVACLWEHSKSFFTQLYQKYDDGNCTGYLKMYFENLELDDEYFEVNKEGFYPLLMERVERIRILDVYNRTEMEIFFCSMKSELLLLEMQVQQHMLNISHLYDRLQHINRTDGPFRKLVNYSNDFHENSDCSYVEDSLHDLYILVCSESLSYGIILSGILFGLSITLLLFAASSGYGKLDEFVRKRKNA
jgi:hypothetical protein